MFIVVLCSWLYCAANLFKLVFRLPWASGNRQPENDVNPLLEM
ncbi:MAG: hypothetical protein Q4A85_10625 [Kingella sp. (in: b-proteobacteria)]|nr:hypothetical protein [Kingella sp. (in: b-proteobacteria)]